ncbi:MAG TPA: hypothetical protein VKT50_03925 [Candidatus Acidoferrales bacterium]|nr:hypothetical protein [Candidatus Acidoferrales bacterium]
MKRAGLILALVLLSVAVARADEFHLKDGSTIVGVIVGYQGNSFRVKTSYGFALVDRDSIASITVAKPNPAEKKTAKSSAPEKAKPADSALQASTSKNETAVAARQEESAKAVGDAKPEEASAAAPQQTSNAVANPATQTANQQPATPPAPETPAPIPVREEVQGNLYINDTYGFSIYKPPGWDLIEGARAALPGAVVAMGTSDQTTYLIIGLEPSSGTLQTHVASTNERLANMFDDYRPLAPRQTIVAGMHAIEYQFQGMANEQQWSGTVMLLSRGDNFFTIFGVASSKTDLVQIQQNVISRTIASLQFTKP